MPKVPEGYVEQKRNDILDAALAVSRSKPLHKITMKDIVRASGLSQGGVYAYYSRIEEVWLALATRFDTGIEFEDRFRQLRDPALSPAEAMRELLRFAELELETALKSGYSKLAFEFNAIYASQAEWFMERMEDHQGTSPSYGFAYMFEQMLTMWRGWVEAGQARPLRPLEEILMLVQVSLSGMIREATLEQYFMETGKPYDPQTQVGLHLTALMEGLHISVSTLLGLQEDSPRETSHTRGEDIG